MMKDLRKGRKLYFNNPKSHCLLRLKTNGPPRYRRSPSEKKLTQRN